MQLQKINKTKETQIRVISLLKTAGIPIPKVEYRFDKTRKWKFDFAYPDCKFAIEIEGGLWIQGRHNRAPGMIKDMEKYNEAAMQGWLVFRYTPQQLMYLVYDMKKLFKGNI